MLADFDGLLQIVVAIRGRPNTVLAFVQEVGLADLKRETAFHGQRLRLRLTLEAHGLGGEEKPQQPRDGQHDAEGDQAQWRDDRPPFARRRRGRAKARGLDGLGGRGGVVRGCLTVGRASVAVVRRRHGQMRSAQRISTGAVSAARTISLRTSRQPSWLPTIT